MNNVKEKAIMFKAINVSYYDSLAQMVEHLPFKQEVWSSSLQ